MVPETSPKMVPTRNTVDGQWKESRSTTSTWKSNKVKLNREAVGAKDVEEAVVNTLKQRYEWETRRNTIAVRRRRRKRRHHILLDGNDSKGEGLGEIDAQNDLSTAFAQV